MARHDALTADAAAGCPSGLSPGLEQGNRNADPSAYVRQDSEGRFALDLMVQGAKCAGCIRKIENGLLALPGVDNARLNLSTGRLAVTWRGALRAPEIVTTLHDIGYGAAAFDPEASRQQVDKEGRLLLRCLAVAGFGAMNIMMFSVPIWGAGGEMGPGARTLMHWWSALIAIPCALYAGRPFFKSAWNALKVGRANMDVPITIAVLLTLGMSVFETMHQGGVAYFDGAVMLLFLLLVGRYLDHGLREKARTAARDLLALQAVTASRIDADGAVRAVAARDIEEGDRLILAPGDRAPVDCVIEDGVTDLDRSLLTGETDPQPAKPGDVVHAGVVNLTRSLHVRASKRLEASMVAELARLIEVGEQGRARFVRIADKAAALYVPVVHSLAALTFVGWMLAPAIAHALGFTLAEIGVRGALMNAVAVLIITCPCALGLAVPAVQVVATGRLFRAGVLVKSGDALERLDKADCIVMDKTGTLTLGRPRLAHPVDAAILQAAAALARTSRHPLSRALVEAAGAGAPAKGVREVPGLGLEWDGPEGLVKLGRRSWAAPEAPESGDARAELWFVRPNAVPARFGFEDPLRPGAKATIAALKARGYRVELISGDRPSTVEAAARAAGIDVWQGGVSPADKIARLDALKAQGKKPLMLGDGLNDAPALAAAFVSVSPGSAIDVAQSAADLVVQGESLAPILVMLDVAKASHQRVIENLGFSALYNVIAVPVAVAGLVTPLIAALAMSGSSLIVTLNALRLSGRVR